MSPIIGNCLFHSIFIGNVEYEIRTKLSGSRINLQVKNKSTNIAYINSYEDIELKTVYYAGKFSGFLTKLIRGELPHIKISGSEFNNARQFALFMNDPNVPIVLGRDYVNNSIVYGDVVRVGLFSLSGVKRASESKSPSEKVPKISPAAVLGSKYITIENVEHKVVVEPGSPNLTITIENTVTSQIYECTQLNFNISSQRIAFIGVKNFYDAVIRALRTDPNFCHEIVKNADNSLTLRIVIKEGAKTTIDMNLKAKNSITLLLRSNAGVLGSSAPEYITSLRSEESVAMDALVELANIASFFHIKN